MDRRSISRRGIALIYTVLVLPALLAVMSLAVDFGRLQLAERELSAAVDAASRYAATGLGDGTYLAKAQAAAAQNYVYGSPLVLTSADVEAGTWDAAAKTFTPTQGTPNALRITGRRNATRGTAVPLYFAALLGKPTFDISESAVIRGASSSYEIVGTAGVKLSGQTTIARASGDTGTLRVASNGTIEAPWSCYVRGDAYYLTTVPVEPGGGITGANVKMTEAVSLPSVTVPSNATNAGAINVGWQGQKFTGNIQCSSLTFGGGGPITFDGDVNFYCSGTVDIGNGVTINTNNGANKVTIYLTSTNTANFNVSSAFRMRVYGPAATVNLNGSSPLTGAVMCKNLNVNGSATITYVDAASLSDMLGNGGGGIAQVK